MNFPRQQLLAGVQPKQVVKEEIDIEPFVANIAASIGAASTLTYDAGDDSYHFKTRHFNVVAKAVNEAILVEVYQMGQIKHRVAYELTDQSADSVTSIMESYSGR